MIYDDDGYEIWASMQRFEPVIDNNMSKHDSEIDTTFKVGDNVYIGLTGKVAQVTEIVDDDVISVANKHNEVRAWVSNICHATQENYELLSKLYPHIEFELPPKEITRSDLTKEMFKRGTFALVCKCSDISEINAIAMSPLRLIVGYSDGYFEENNGTYWKFAVPYDPKTRVPLRQDVLNEKI